MTATETATPARPQPPRRRRRRWVLLALALAVALAVAGLLLPGVLDGEPVAAPPPPAEPVEAPVEVPPAAPPEDLLSWAPPVLEDPEVVEITQEYADVKLDLDKDYELVMPDEPLQRGMTVYGGRNVVIIGGEISLPDRGEDDQGGLRGLYMRDQTGTVHVEGLKIGGPGLGEGINLDQREGAVVQLQNIWVGEVFGTVEGHHGDLIQTWAGPRQLLVDGLSGSTGYQGFFLLPKQFGDQPEPEVFDLRRVDITSAEEGSGYLLWRDERDWPIETTDVWVDPDDAPEDREDYLWDRDGEDSWADVQIGVPPEGTFVPEDLPGTGYETPGYRAQG